MKHIRTLPVILAVSACLLLPAAVMAQRYVAQGTNVPDGQYLTWATAATNIHDAVDVAVPGETVWVGPGTYRRDGVTTVLSVSKSIHLRSVDGPETTIIDGQGVRRGVYIDVRSLVDVDLLIEGFTIANGYTSDYGGGIYFLHSASTVTGTGVVENCIITNCEVTVSDRDRGGGGAYIRGSSTTDFLFVMRDCTVVGNRTAGRNGGAGVYLRENLSLVEDCRFLNNELLITSTYSGGGIYAVNAVAGTIIRNSLFAGNVSGNGAGLAVLGSSSLTIDSCVIRDNIGTRYGGGLYISSSMPVVVRNCLVYNNQASNRGSGIASYGGAGVILENSTVTSNRNTSVGGYGSAGVLIENSTTTAYIRNSILDNNYTAAGGHANLTTPGSTPIITNSCITTGALPPDSGNISDPPEFI
ncbi:MAG: right-handed parallel beta-helix repeat-containing protein, partial [Lentisphaerae bacterium]|nr:right-handed parallel beta-helix repeat-containing protein [Lentisphaerota bacterium]